MSIAGTIGVIGYGRFGEMWARTLAAMSRTVVYDLKWERAESVPVLPEPLEAARFEQVAGSDLLFLSVPVS